MTMRDFGVDVRRCRKRLNLRQDELADRAGVSLTTIRNWEGAKTPERGKLLQVIAVAEALGMDVKQAVARVGYDPALAPSGGASATREYCDRDQLKADLDLWWSTLTDDQCSILHAWARAASNYSQFVKS